MLGATEIDTHIVKQKKTKQKTVTELVKNVRNVAYSCDLISQDLLLLLPLLPSSSSLSLSLSLYMRVCVSGCVLVLFYFVVGVAAKCKESPKFMFQ